MAKKIIKLYREDELQNNASLTIKSNGEEIIVPESDKTAIKNIHINVDVAQAEMSADLIVQRVSGSFGSSGETYLSLSKPTNANDYIISSESGKTLTECDAIAFDGVTKVYIWGNGYATGSYNYGNFVSLANNKTYSTAKAVTINNGDVFYLEHYYRSTAMHSSGSGA